MDYVEVPLFGKYSHLKCKLDKDWYQMICVDGGLNLCYREHHGYVFFQGYSNGKRNHDDLHQIIMNNKGYPKKNSIVVDHINGDKLDNRRCNLRLVTQADNRRGFSSKRIDNKTGIAGLCKRLRRGCTTYIVQFRLHKKRLYYKETLNYLEAKLLAEFHNSIRYL